MRFLGVDLAWKDGNPSGVALLAGQRFPLRLREIPHSLGRVLPFLLIVGFWVFIAKQRKSAKKPDGLPKQDAPLVVKSSSSDAETLAKRIGLGN